MRIGIDSRLIKVRKNKKDTCEKKLVKGLQAKHIASKKKIVNMFVYFYYCLIK